LTRNGLGVDEEEPAAHRADQHPLVVLHQRAGVDADAVGAADLLDRRHRGVCQFQRLAVGGVAGLDGRADLVGVVRVQQHGVGPELQRLERRPGLLGGLDARDEVRLLADAGDEVLQRDDRPVLADDDGVVGIAGGLLGQFLVTRAQHPDVRAGGALGPAEGRQVGAPGEVARQVDRPVALAALPDDDGVRVGLLLVLGLVDDVDVVAGERGDVDPPEFADPRHVPPVDEHPVDAGLEAGGDAALACLPVADRVVGLQPDGA
jgi:hypothetical protein